jgi:GNAT superfamily N-acetyltransferase
MELQRLDPDDLDPRDVAGGVAVLEAARRVDSPHHAPQTATGWTADLRFGWDGEPPVAYLHRDAAGRVDSVLQVSTSERDNKHLAYLELTVRPDVRRQGLGRALWAAGVDLARAQSRTTVVVECWDRPHNLAFADALGLPKATVGVNRRQVMDEVDWSRVDTLVKEAVEHSSHYELLRMPMPVPEELVDRTVAMTAAINDAPTDDIDWEDEVFSPERLRDFERSLAEHGRRVYRLAARHRATGDLAGQTIVAVDTELPWLGHQLDTSVLREHRGHRLGLLLKGTMLHWLAEEEPQLLEIDTWNAASNDHMIAVNEALGYRVVGTATGFQVHV